MFLHISPGIASQNSSQARSAKYHCDWVSYVECQVEARRRRAIYKSREHTRSSGDKNNSNWDGKCISGKLDAVEGKPNESEGTEVGGTQRSAHAGKVRRSLCSAHTGAPEWEWEMTQKRHLEKKIAEKFPNLIKIISPQTQKAQQNLRTKKIHHDHIMWNQERKKHS